MIAKLLWLLACAFLDAGHCKRWHMDKWGLWCAEVQLKNSCPVQLEHRGWHKMAGTTVCTIDCGSEPPTS